MKIVTILGARPQFIKAASVSREIKNQVNNGIDINEIIVHTGQHYDVNMSDIFFEEMKIPKPHYSLGIRGNSQGQMTGKMIDNIEDVLLEESPDWVLVFGDTNSTLAGAIGASKLNIKIAHIEAGLRSFNMNMPEEINRILTDRVSSLLFCPTKVAVKNLTNEGFDHWKNNAEIVLSGDVMQDSAIYYKEFSKKPIDINIEDNFILGTIHRAENTDNPDKLTSVVLPILDKLNIHNISVIGFDCVGGRYLANLGDKYSLSKQPELKKYKKDYLVLPGANRGMEEAKQSISMFLPIWLKKFNITNITNIQKCIKECIILKLKNRL